MFRLFSCLFFIVLISGCDTGPPPEADTAKQIVSTSIKTGKPVHGCKKCHKMVLDPKHDLDCSSCHGGDDGSDTREQAHQGFIRQPAHPDHMMDSCGECHREQVQDLQHSLHMTLSNSVNLVRQALGATDSLAGLTEIPITPQPEDLVQLGDDLLRRRCLRCHLYTEGDDFPAVRRPTGCGACHLDFSVSPLSHTFIGKPKDDQCLRCHYGNRVGFDYHGRFEHDFNEEYRTPISTTVATTQQYGLEFHDLSPDIHFKKGLICIDCHAGRSLMGAKTKRKITCRSCHDPQELGRRTVAGIILEDGKFFLRAQGDNRLHKIPLMTDPAHQEYEEQIDCQVCHALWSFNDSGVHLLRSDLDEYEPFQHLISQGSSEVTTLLEASLNFDEEDPEPVMTDKITGEKRPGVWYKGFGQRRWESITLGRDNRNRIRVMRPMLDLHLSWLNEDEEVRFDSVVGPSNPTGLTPYTPHTTGRAGLFYRERLHAYLHSKQRNISETTHPHGLPDNP